MSITMGTCSNSLTRPSSSCPRQLNLPWPPSSSQSSSSSSSSPSSCRKLLSYGFSNLNLKCYNTSTTITTTSSGSGSISNSSTSSSMSIMGSSNSSSSSSNKQEVVAVAAPESGEEIYVAPSADLSVITEWELDFCSRPILDERRKKIWEIAACDSRGRFRFARFYPNNVINSITLKEAIAEIVHMFGLPKPQKIRFFRSQMQTIISKACSELDIQPVPSKRCTTLVRWLEERFDNVYRSHPGFQEGAQPLLQTERTLPVDLPDELRGERWAFVQLPLSAVLQEAAAVDQGSTFGSTLDLDILGLDLSPDAMIPGVAVASPRATPLAAWTNALELSTLEVDMKRACLVLSTGVNERWLYAFYRKSRSADQEAEAWEAAKKASGGLHFIAVQQSLDSDLCLGFWLLLDTPRLRV